MKLNINKTYMVDIETYHNDSGNYHGNNHSNVLYHMPESEMENHLDDDDPKCFFDTQIDREVTFCYMHPKDAINDAYEWRDVETLLDEIIGDRMEFTGEPRDYYYTIIAVHGIYECYWDDKDNRWWYKDENIFDKYIKENK